MNAPLPKSAEMSDSEIEPTAFEEDIAQPVESRRAWLRAGWLFGGALTWSMAIFGAMVEHALWVGASAAFGCAATVGCVFTLSVQSGYLSRPASIRHLLRRAGSTLLVGFVVFLLYSFLTLLLFERSADAAMLLLGFLGILTVFAVLALSEIHRRPRPDVATRCVHALVWFTVALISTTTLVPPLAEWMAHRSRSPQDAAAAAEPSSAGDD